MNRKLIPAILAVTFFALTLGAQQAPPKPGPAKPFNLPGVEEFTLDNGLEVRMVQWGTVPKATVRLVVQTGNADESANQIWLADLMADLLEQGTTTRTSEEVALELARMGGNLNVGVGMNTTQIGTDVLSPFAADAVEIVADVATHPAFPESELDRLRNDLLRNLSVAKTQPQQLALEAYTRIVYPDHAYGRIFPTEAMINGYSLADVRKFWNDQFGATRSWLYVVGQFDASEVRTAIREEFSSWKAGTEAKRISLEPKPYAGLWLVDRPGSVQSTLRVGQRVVDPTSQEQLALTLTNTLLGGYFSSRVTANIREDKGYTYSPGSSISSNLGAATYTQVADVTTAFTGPSLKEIFYEIDRLQKEAPPQAELDAARNYMIGVFVLQNSSRSGIIGQLNYMDLHQLSDDYLETFIPRLQRLTPEDIRKTAAKYLGRDKMTIVVVGDRAEIEEQIKPYGKIQIIP